jgi:integrase
MGSGSAGPNSFGWMWRISTAKMVCLPSEARAIRHERHTWWKKPALFSERWLGVRGIAAGPMFPPLAKSGHLIPKRLTCEGIAQILTRRAAEANIERFSCHDLRRSFVTHLLDAADLAVVQKLAGHRQISTTAVCDKRGEAAKLKAAELVRLPIGA